MSITEDARSESRPPAQPSAGGPGPGGLGPGNPGWSGGQFDKSPPQDVAAEQGVLGGMLLSKDAIADVIEILKTHDFYRPVHGTIFDTVLDLYGRGEPADALTVAAALADSGDLQRIGGVPYLHTLIESVPTAANAAYYARIVAERAILRRLVEAGTKIVQLGYGAGGNGGRDVDDIVDLAQQAVYDVTEKRVSEDFAALGDMLQPTLDEIEAVGAQGGVMSGVPTGFSDLDRLLNGLHPGQLIIVAGRPGLGKALALDTPIPTPAGWITMGDIKAGDVVLGEDGRPTTVTHAFEVRTGRPCFEVEFSDGSTVVADGDHLWKVTSRQSRRRRTGDAAHIVARHVGNTALAERVHRPPVNADTTGSYDVVLTTRQIEQTYRHPTDRGPNYSVDNCRPLQLPERDDLPVPPYALGARLAKGNEHIPSNYLRSSERQRRELLAGLLDADGTVTSTGTIQFRSTSKELVEGLYELVVSLGYRCSTTRRQVTGRSAQTSIAYTLNFSTVDEVFGVAWKRQAHQQGRAATSTYRSGARHITAVRPVPSVPVRCIAVDNQDHMYLAGRSMIPTHNSTVSMDFARNAAIRSNCASAIFSLEMSKIEMVMRLLSAEARVPLHVLRSGQLTDDDWSKLARRMGEISEAPIFVDDTPSMNLMEIRAKARRLKQRHDLKLLVVDYLQLMTSPKRTESRQQEVADLSRGLKLLAKEIDCPVIAVSQLNRGPEQRTDKRPQLADLRESGSIEQDADVVILLHRDDYYDKESPRAGEADFIVAKHRNGPTDTVTVAAQLHLSRFVDMAIV